MSFFYISKKSAEKVLETFFSIYKMEMAKN